TSSPKGEAGSIWVVDCGPTGVADGRRVHWSAWADLIVAVGKLALFLGNPAGVEPRLWRRHPTVGRALRQFRHIFVSVSAVEPSAVCGRLLGCDGAQARVGRRPGAPKPFGADSAKTRSVGRVLLRLAFPGSIPATASPICPVAAGDPGHRISRRAV